MYIFKGENEIRNELQDDLETCKRIAFEDYGVPYNCWKEIKGGNKSIIT